MSKLGEKFIDLFAGLNRAYGVYELAVTNPTEPGQKLTGRALTVQEPVNTWLWDEHLKGVKGLGIVPIRDDSTCCFGAIDIDEYELDIPAILLKIKENHLPLLACQSKSGGLHLYVFTSQPVPATLLRSKLKEWASVLGKPDVEIFPKQTQIMVDRGDIGQWINMPYFGNTRQCLVLNQANRYTSMSAEQFVSAAEHVKMSLAELNAFTVTVFSNVGDGPPCLEKIIKSGGFIAGMRNEGVFALAVYLKQSQPNTWDQVLDKYNQKFVDPPLSSVEVQGIVKSLKRKNYQYACERPPLTEYCDKVKCATRRFGAEAAGLPQLSGLTKLEASPALWFLTINEDNRICLQTEDLQNQTKFQRVCLETVNIMTPTVSSTKWRNIVSSLLSTVTIIKVSEDIKPEGRFVEHLEYFCTIRASARTKAEIILGKSWTDNGRHYFRIHDLLQHLERQRFRDLPPNRITAKLREMKGKSEVFKVKGRSVRVWSIPIFKIDESEAEKPFDIKGITPVDGGGEI